MSYLGIMLPGFHEDPHNNKWWGKGFTEWQSVAASKPIFPGHQQPEFCSWGEYDLSCQKDVDRCLYFAKNSGLDAISLYHYWFEGEAILDQPRDLIFNSQVAMPITLYWANHSWTRTWSNRSDEPEMLMDQTYSLKDAREHAEFLAKYMALPKYFRQDRKFIFAIYDAVTLLDTCPGYIEEMDAVFSERLDNKVDFHLGIRDVGELYRLKALAAKLKVNFKFLVVEPSYSFKSSRSRKTMQTVSAFLPAILKRVYYAFRTDGSKREEYGQYLQTSLSNFEDLTDECTSPIIPSVCVGFDNTPRYKDRARILTNFSAEALTNHLDRLRFINKTDFVYINALNEWGEGMALEPSSIFGTNKADALKAHLSREQTND